MTTRLYSDEIFLTHENPPGHPERVDRLRAIDKALADPLFDGLDRQKAVRASREQVLLAHPEPFVAALENAVPDAGFAAIDADTAIAPGTIEAAFHAVGSACAGVDAVMTGEIANAFCASRPPGHHAEATTAMGFCYFSTAAIAALHAQEAHGAERVAVVDFDVHHGNGTQDIFWSRPDMLYASSHQMPLFPGTGRASERGAGDAGNIVNVPLSHGDGTAPFQAAYDDVILPAVEDFAPDLIIVSAGFDAHHRDPLGGLQLSEDDFDWVTARIMEVAEERCDSRVVSVLEGGYDLLGLATSTAAHVRRLMTG